MVPAVQSLSNSAAGSNRSKQPALVLSKGSTAALRVSSLRSEPQGRRQGYERVPRLALDAELGRSVEWSSVQEVSDKQSFRRATH
jgi:hypothetical protein